MLVFTLHLVFIIHAGIYTSCWYLLFMLVFIIHAGIYTSCWYLRFMLVFTLHAGIYDSCWYLRRILMFMTNAGIYDTCWYLCYMLACRCWYKVSIYVLKKKKGRVELGQNSLERLKADKWSVYTSPTTPKLIRAFKS